MVSLIISREFHFYFYFDEDDLNEALTAVNSNRKNKKCENSNSAIVVSKTDMKNDLVE